MWVLVLLQDHLYRPQTPQHLDAFTSRSSSTLVLTPHPDPFGLLVQIQSIPRGHLLSSRLDRPHCETACLCYGQKGKRGILSHLMS